MGRLTIACAVLGLLAGCSREREPASSDETDVPVADETAMPEDDVPVEDAQPPLPPPKETGDVAATVLDDRLLWQLARDQAADLREYAAKAAPDDPFAMSEEDIRRIEESGVLSH